MSSSRVWTVKDILGSSEEIIIHYRGGIPDHVPVEDLPGLRFKRLNAKTLREYRTRFGGKVGKKGNPVEANRYLAKETFIGFVNFDSQYSSQGFNSELDWLFNHPEGQLLMEFSIPTYVNREVPDMDEGNE
jgi:hypothetical protein